MTFKQIPAGSFVMGGPVSEGGDEMERPQHTVHLSAFELQSTEVTQKQWWDVMGSWPGTAPDSTYGVGDNHPMYNVSWCDIVGAEGDTTFAHRCANYNNSFLSRLNALGQGTYRLPTEAEWEYAARAGSTSAYACGGTAACLANMAWYTSNSGGKTKAVATKLPNIWGLYDMHGNVSEWVQDLYDSYSSTSVTDPTGPTFGLYPILRGGSMQNSATSCRSAYRNITEATTSFRQIGFRLVRIQ